MGLWNSDNEDITFHVAASEKARRSALREAFEIIQKNDRTYGCLDDLVVVTAQFAPKDTQKIRKSRTIQTYSNYFAKTDFESVDEYYEFQQYIVVLLTERYSRWGVSELAVSFYLTALSHYREFVREHACNTQSQHYSYRYFLTQDLRLLTRTLTRDLLPDDVFPDTALDEPWPLKGFADAASGITGVSLHKLHQYHQFKQEGPPDEQVWTRDFTSKEVNTRSKQVIERLRKHNQIKWEIFYPTLQPLTYHLPKAIEEKSFAIHAFAALICHNLNAHVAEFGPFEPQVRGGLTHGQTERNHSIPSSDLLDLLYNDHPVGEETCMQQVPIRYQAMLDAIKTLPGSLHLATDIPNNLDQIYKQEHRRFPEAASREPLVNGPAWLDEWGRAKNALLAGDTLLALSRFNIALEQAKYAAGPLFIPLYIQICAFCKSQYRQLSERKETELFEQFYEGLGRNATDYAKLIGYTPQYKRDPKTLLSHSTLPQKSQLIIREIDALARALRD